MVLTDADRRQLIDGDDAEFYAQPRFVHHVDDGFRARLTALYEQELTPADRVLDLMSSWVSHLPDGRSGEVIGHGLNAAELAANEQLDDYWVANLNETQSFPHAEAAFDAVVCAVSVQYLQYPKAVFAEIGRVLRPGGVCIVSFSNRMFVQKAIRAWRERDMDGRAALVADYIDATGVFAPPRVTSDQPASDPFYAVVARRQ